MAKGDYPTGALVEVLREYKNDGGDIEVYKRAVWEMKNMMLRLVKLEATQQPAQEDTGCAHRAPRPIGENLFMCDDCGTTLRR